MTIQHDPAVIAGVCLVAEAAIARAIALSPGTAGQLAQLHPVELAIASTKPTIDVFLVINGDGEINVSSYRETEPTVCISGSSSAFLKVASASDPAAALINGNIKITGYTAVLLTLQNVLSDLNIDWEAPMVDLLGPIIGHQLANLLRGLTTTSKVAHQSARRQLSEFILEEARLSPPRAELDAFLGSVDDMVLRVDRAESRLKRLKNRVDILTGASA